MYNWRILSLTITFLLRSKRIPNTGRRCFALCTSDSYPNIRILNNIERMSDGTFLGMRPSGAFSYRRDNAIAIRLLNSHLCFCVML